MYIEKFRRPIVSVNEMMREYASGAIKKVGQYHPFMYRALVLAVDPEGGKLETPDGKPWNRTFTGPSLVIDWNEGADKSWFSGELVVTHTMDTPYEWKSGGEQLEQEVIVNGLKITDFNVKPTIGPINPPNSVKARIVGNTQDEYLSDDEARCYWPMFPEMAQSVSPGEMVYVVFEDESCRHGLWISKVVLNSANQTSNQSLLTNGTKEVMMKSLNAPKPKVGDKKRLTKLFTGG